MSVVLETNKKSDPISIEERFVPTNDKVRISQEYPNQVKKELFQKDKMMLKETAERDKDTEKNIAQLDT